MSYRHIALLGVLLLLSILPLSAEPLFPAEVFVETEEVPISFPYLESFTWWWAGLDEPYATRVAFPLIWDVPRIELRAPLRAFGEGNVLGADRETIYLWHGSHAFDPILRYDHELSEITVRGGNFLAAERFGGKLIEFNLQGRVAEYAF